MPRTKPKRQRVAVLFPDDWAPYSPTLTRLVTHLQARAEIDAWVIDTGRFPVTDMPSPPYRPVRLCGIVARLRLSRILAALALAWAGRAALRKADTVVAVDFRGALAATLVGRRFHFVSLELTGLYWLRRLLRVRADSILVQSEERLAYLQLRGGRLPCAHLVQNAPDLAELPPAPPWRMPDGRIRLIYLGNVIPMHGLAPMLDLLRILPEADLVLHGPASDATKSFVTAQASDLLSSGRLRLDTSFVDELEIPALLRRHDIGLCLYDLPRAMARNPNYLTSPSGKMFNYFAAGLPVLASWHPGLSPVSIYNAGLQVQSLDATTLADACRKIIGRLPEFREASASAARYYDFGKAVIPFLDEVTGDAS